MSGERKNGGGARKKRQNRQEANGALLTPELVADCLRFGVRQFVRASSAVQTLRERLPADDCRQPLLTQIRENFDDAFAIALRETVMVRQLAKTTDSTEMLFDALGDALYGADDLPELLCLSDRFAEPTDLDGSSSDSFYFHFATTVVHLVTHLEALSTKYPERFRLLARELPYWPMLVFRHKSANNHLFEKSADGQRPLAELLELGVDCPINVSSRANYSLKTPVNSFLWDILRELYWGRDWLRSLASKGITGQAAAQTLRDRTDIPVDEAALHVIAFSLPPLDKSTSDEWVDAVLMPWIRLKYPDLRQLPAFRSLPVGPTGRRYAVARKMVLRALRNLARKPGAGWA